MREKNHHKESHKLNKYKNIQKKTICIESKLINENINLIDKNRKNKSIYKKK